MQNNSGMRRMNVTEIPATLNMSSFLKSPMAEVAKRRVAAYARVSTDDEEQLKSYNAQASYYTEHIQSNPDWEFVGVYADEGITGTSTKNRKEFNRMISDALEGKIDLIITKSVSRFARNTVDSLVTIRKLKDKGIEVYFEKENIYTLDSKGEFLLTIMSSIAQEESRSISENVTWGKRKSFKDRNVSLAYKSFLGYEKGKDGRPQIVEEEASIIRTIYRLFLQDMSPKAIGAYLTSKNIPTPCGKTKWSPKVIESILTNEKYKGDAILQKTYTVDFLTHKVKKNQGEVPQFYVKNSHAAIIDPEIFDLVQHELKKRQESGRYTFSHNHFTGKIICGHCGEAYGSRTLHANTKYEQVVWKCRSRYTGSACSSGNISTAALEQAFVTAFNSLVDNKAEIIEVLRAFVQTSFDFQSIDAELSSIDDEIQMVLDVIRSYISDNASTVQDQEEYERKYNVSANKFAALQKRKSELEDKRNELVAKKTKIDMFASKLEERDVLTEFSLEAWYATADHITIKDHYEIEVHFRSDSVVSVRRTVK